MLSTSSAFAQDQQTHGITTIGEMAKERTVADIMKNPEPISADAFLKHLIKSNEIEIDRDHLPLDPNSPAVSQWPPAKNLGNGNGSTLRGGGRYNPQTPGVNWQGDIYGNLTPSDAFGAVGPTQVLVTTNHNVTVFSKTGVVGALNTTLDNFFSTVRNGSGTSDPRATFDRTTNRWFVIAINVSTPNRTLIAVSDTATITGATVWRYFFTTAPANTFDDYCSLGVDANGAYIGYNIFVPSSYGGNAAIVVQKSSILGVGPIVSTRFTMNGATAEGPYSPRGVDNDDPAPANGYIVGGSNIAFGRLVVRKVTGANTVAPTLGPNLLITVPATANPITPVPSNGINLDQIDDRVYQATIHLNRKTGTRSLWMAHHIRGNNTGTGTSTGDRNIARWYQLDVAPAAPTLLQSGTSFESGTADHYSFPTCAMTGQGHMAMGFSMSKAGSFIRTGASGRLAGDASGTTQATTVAYTATQAYNVFATRWGDYSMCNVDPADDQTCWIINHQSAGTSWQVRVTQLKAPGPSPIASVAPNVLVPGNNYNLTVTGTPTSGSEYFDTDATYPNRLAAAFSGGDVTVNSITFSHAAVQSMTLNVTVSPAAPNGGRNLTITNPDGQNVSLTNAVTIQGSINQTIAPSSMVLNLGAITGGSVSSLASTDGVYLTICQALVPTLTSPFARFSVDGTTTLTNLTAYAFSSVAKMNNAGVFTETVEAYNFSTATYDVSNAASIGLAISTLTVTVPSGFNNYVSGGVVRARISVRKTGLSPVPVPCTSFDQAFWSLTGN